MAAMKEGTDHYLSSFPLFESRLTAPARSPLLERLRSRAIERFAALGFPTLRDEEWRFTNLAPLLGVPFEPADGLAIETGDRSLARERRTDFAANVPTSALRSSPPIVVCSLTEALLRHADLVEPHLGQLADFEQHVFTALNTAFLDDGIFVHVPAGKSVEEPIVVDFQSPRCEKPAVRHRRCLIVMGANSQARIVERFEGAEGTYFTNAVTEIVVAENAILDYYRPQRESNHAFHVATVQVRQERSSNFTAHLLAVGGKIARTDTNVVLGAPGCECTINGLYLASGDRLIDNHTRIDHARPNCTSHELFQGILDGRAHGVFNGKIYVHQDAQKTDAKQTNRTLLLSDSAVIDTKPQLEIYADDVKCTHGASIGQLDPEQIFYLRTRGIDPDAARRLLIFAFANNIIGRIKIDALRAEMESLITSQ
jgi:Fe-S cluster assembly protein SufD